MNILSCFMLKKEQEQKTLTDLFPPSLWNSLVGGFRIFEVFQLFVNYKEIFNF